MSSSAPHDGATASDSAVIEYYFCHQCCLATLLFADEDCPLCGCTFLEAIDDPPLWNLNPYPSPFLAIGSVSHSPASFTLCSSADVDSLFHSDISPLFPLFSNRIFAEAYIKHLISLGTHVHAVVMGVPPLAPGPLTVPLTFNDLGEFACQIFDNELEQGRDLFHTGTSESAIATLPNVEITEATASSEAQCTVCLETYAVGTEAAEFPCNHVFHRECIIPWLNLRNTCPECRFQLPMEDERGRGSTVVFLIVLVPLTWVDAPDGTVIVPRRLPGRLLGRWI